MNVTSAIIMAESESIMNPIPNTVLPTVIQV